MKPLSVVDEERAAHLGGLVDQVHEWQRDGKSRLDQVERIQESLKRNGWPSVVAEEYFQFLRDDGTVSDERLFPLARPLVRETVWRYPEYKYLHGAVWQIRWRTRTWTRQGQATLGSCSPVPRADREAWTGAGPAPQFRLQLSLPYWLVMDETERLRLVHHELGHACWKEDGSPGTCPHDIEEFAATLARFGISEDERPLQAVLAAVSHPETTIRLRALQGTQQELWPAPSSPSTH